MPPTTLGSRAAHVCGVGQPAVPPWLAVPEAQRPVLPTPATRMRPRRQYQLYKVDSYCCVKQELASNDAAEALDICAHPHALAKVQVGALGCMHSRQPPVRARPQRACPQGQQAGRLEGPLVVAVCSQGLQQAAQGGAPCAVHEPPLCCLAPHFTPDHSHAFQCPCCVHYQLTCDSHHHYCHRCCRQGEGRSSRELLQNRAGSPASEQCQAYRRRSCGTCQRTCSRSLANHFQWSTTICAMRLRCLLLARLRASSSSSPRPTSGLAVAPLSFTMWRVER